MTPSPLASTDPEFWSFYSAFAFGDILEHSSLDEHDRLVYQLAATISVGAVSEFRALLELALDSGVTPVEVKEVAYQAVAYVGIARVVDFLFAINQELAARGIDLPLPGQSKTTPDTRAELGLAKQGEIVGAERLAGMRSAAPADAMHFQEFLAANCFGDYYTRTGFGVRQRELITFALLVALGGADAQVRGHVTANVNVGNTRQNLLDVLTVLVPYIGYPRTLNGLAAVNEVAPASTKES
ncbi:carboxymuconolactone decarboxylase family protein [Frondihabitans australicus]|uniref:4-carboxymuconolactone decarboxylase n=1 Tax=Frondihabitans australicus TaxID=386892 RepID=A0A495ID83_9MICO|nr:carboxymuconolactone decarboxylase family protein [Frondihabitans australicus]RKR73418.1 4-carboxymuconolactone decarboxylase [Frondihabitans australicus]